MSDLDEEIDKGETKMTFSESDNFLFSLFISFFFF